MARAPIHSISAPSPLQPRAAPVDAYVRPADPAPSSLHDLANGLAALDAGVGGFLAKRKEDQDKLDAIRGEAAFNKANQTGWAEAVKQGLVPANASPVFMENYKKAQGNVAGLQLREKFRAAYLQWDGRNSNDPNAYSNFVARFIHDNVGEGDPYVLEGLNPHIRALYEEGYSTFSEERSQATYNGAVATQGALATETIQGAEADGLQAETGTDYEAMWNSITALRQQALASGIRQADYDKTLAQTIAAEAERTNNTQLLKLFEKTLPGSDHAMDTFPEFKAIRDKAMEAIEANLRQAEVDGERHQNKIDKERENSIMVGIARAFAEDPTAEVPENVVKELERYDPNARKHIAETRKALMEADSQEDPEAMLEITEAVRNGATEEYIWQKMRDGVIRDRATYEHFLDRIQKYRDSRAKGGGIIATQGAKRVLDNIKAATTPDDLLAEDPFGVNGGITKEGLQATHDFEIMLMEWEAANPEASAIDREKAVNEIGQLIIGRIDRADPGAPNYVTPDEANKAAQEANQKLLQDEQAGTSGGQEQQPAAAVPEASFSVEQSYSGDQPPDIKTLPQEQQTYINNEAKRLGVTPEEYNKAMWSKIRELLSGQQQQQQQQQEARPEQRSEMTAPDGTLIQPASLSQGDAGAAFNEFVQQAASRVPADAVSAIESILQAGNRTAGTDPQVRSASPVLDLIGQSEGTDRARGYNETFSYGKFTGGDVDLTNMTLGQIDQLQAKMAADPANTRKSTAVGRYQIMRPTLQDAKAALGLDDGTRFTKEVQDNIAMWLLERRGLSKFLKGEISREDFSDALAHEWASLPTVQGVSAYADQKARTSVASLGQVLDQISGVAPAVPQVSSFGQIRVADTPAFRPAEVDDMTPTTSRYWNYGTMKADSLVIHHTGGRGTVGGVVQTFRDRGYPAHFVIDRDGKLHQVLRIDQRGQHVKNSEINGVTNANSWGVEIIAKDDKDVTPAQAQSAVRLAKMLHEQYGMPMDHIFGHGEINSHKQATEGHTVVSILRQAVA